MSVSIAEYCGKRVDCENKIIPVKYNGKVLCPFMNNGCTKANKKNPLPPVCSVRKPDGTLWIVCQDRLCATKKNIPLADHQTRILHHIASTVSGEILPHSSIHYARESKIPVTEKSSYSADYVLKIDDQYGSGNSPKKFVLEMQGGGETTDTKHLTDHIRCWENKEDRTNEFLRQIIKKTSTLETNAWRRQQEQFLVKGNVAVQTGGAIVFCVGSLLYDYLNQRIIKARLKNLQNYNWNLAILAFKEDKKQEVTDGSVPLVIDNTKTLYTSYSSFLQMLTNQGEPCPSLFTEGFSPLG